MAKWRMAASFAIGHSPSRLDGECCDEPRDRQRRLQDAPRRCGGHDAWKVGGKMFACIGAVMPGVSLKTDSVETAQMLIEAGVGVKAPYFHRSWVNLPWGTAEAELRHRITASYRLVRASLTRRAQSELAPFERAIADAPDETDVGSCVRRPRTTHRKTG
jgi:predicted DNA-binding protein (MmcQ/YjbR family)